MMAEGYRKSEKGSPAGSEATGRHRLPRQRTSSPEIPRRVSVGTPTRAERFRLLVGSAVRRAAGVARLFFRLNWPVLAGVVYGLATVTALLLLAFIVVNDLK